MNISTLEIKGFKSYVSNELITLNNLNVFAGINSVGKSTTIQSLLLLRLLYEDFLTHNKERSEAYINSEKYGLELGSFERIISGNDAYIELGINNNKLKIEVKDGDSLKINSKFKEFFAKEKYSIYTPNFYYLSAERTGPRDYQKVDSLGIDNCGIRGEYSFHLLNKYSDKQVDDYLLFSETGRNIDKTLKNQTEIWLNNLFHGIEFHSTLDKALRIVKLEVKQRNQDMGYVTLNNVGFGLSYVLPIILTCLNSVEDSFIIIENPEAHLHPKGQSLMGKFLAQVSSANRQIIVETHSEHIINGMRLYYLENKIPPEKLAINFFSVTENQTRVSKISLNEKMEMMDWPEDFFDQQEIDLREMRRVRRNNG